MPEFGVDVIFCKIEIEGLRTSFQSCFEVGGLRWLLGAYTRSSERGFEVGGLKWLLGALRMSSETCFDVCGLEWVLGALGVS